MIAPLKIVQRLTAFIHNTDYVNSETENRPEKSQRKKRTESRSRFTMHSSRNLVAFYRYEFSVFAYLREICIAQCAMPMGTTFFLLCVIAMRMFAVVYRAVPPKYVYTMKRTNGTDVWDGLALPEQCEKRQKGRTGGHIVRCSCSRGWIFFFFSPLVDISETQSIELTWMDEITDGLFECYCVCVRAHSASMYAFFALRRCSFAE